MDNNDHKWNQSQKKTQSQLVYYSEGNFVVNFAIWESMISVWFIIEPLNIGDANFPGVLQITFCKRILPQNETLISGAIDKQKRVDKK